MSEPYLPAGLPHPVSDADGLYAPHFEAMGQGRLTVQACAACGARQMPPAWICHRCHAFDVAWTEIEPKGRIHSWTRCWHPVHPALKGATPYLVAVVELENAGGLRLVGNLLGDPVEDVVIGAPVAGVFEHHQDADPPYSLLQWARA